MDPVIKAYQDGGYAALRMILERIPQICKNLDDVIKYLQLTVKAIERDCMREIRKGYEQNKCDYL